MTLKRHLPQLLAIALLPLMWELTARWFNRPELFPTLPRLIEAVGELLTTERFYLSVGATVVRGAGGLLLSLVAATGMAWLFARYNWLYVLCRPALTVMRSVPVISFILFALLFLSPEGIPLLIAFLTMFPLLTENLTKGLCHLRPGFSVMATLFRVGGYNRFTQIIYPQLNPYLFSGLASAAGFGWRAIIMGEVLSQCTFGIGSGMKLAQQFIAVPELMAWTVVALLLGWVTDRGLRWLSLRRMQIGYSAESKESPFKQTPVDISLHGVGYSYGPASFTYTFQAGRIYGLSAPSGSGKSTLLNLMNGVLKPVCGEVKLDRRHGIASLFQEPELLPWLSAVQNVALPIARFMPEQEAIDRAECLLQAMQLDVCQMASHLPDQLSYGQQQRVALARALAFPATPILLMDEPFKGLDEATRSTIIGYIRRWQRERGQTILFTSHNRDELNELADEILFLDPS